MNEVTVIATVEVTKIYKNAPECFKLNKEALSTVLKEKVRAGDVSGQS